jgi:hypothetical protein
MLKQGLGDEAKKVPFISVPDFVARMVALFDPIVRGRLYELGKRRLVSSEKARRMFDWTSRPVTETVLDTARSLQASDLLGVAGLTRNDRDGQNHYRGNMPSKFPTSMTSLP